MEGHASTRWLRFWRRRWVRRVFWFVVSVYVILCGMLFLFQGRIIFPRHFAPKPIDEPYWTDAVALTLDLGKGRKAFAWYLPAPEASAEKPAPCIVFFHGNAETADIQHDLVDGYHALGCSVLLPEYRGYGHADGRPSQKAILADAARFYDMVVERPEVDAGRIVFQGRSVGGGFAACLAAERKPAALILESTFTSVVSMARRYLVPPFLVRHPLRVDRVLKRFDAPVLIMHGSRDGVIPIAHGRKLAQLARDGRYIEYDCGHIGLLEQPGYWDNVARFLTDVGVLQK
jgi:pimeloyl-ACP methyl ester carboxylesterase